MNYFNRKANRTFLRTACLIPSALLGMVAVTALPPIALLPAAAQVEPAPLEATNVQTRLQGRWEATDPTTGEVLTFIFTPEGELYILGIFGSEPPTAIKFGYAVNPSPAPYHLDVILSPEETVMTIFDFTGEGQLQLQLVGTEPGLPRPSDFSAESNYFDKVSDAGTLPEGTEIFDPQSMGNPGQ